MAKLEGAVLFTERMYMTDVREALRLQRSTCDTRWLGIGALMRDWLERKTQYQYPIHRSVQQGGREGECGSMSVTAHYSTHRVGKQVCSISTWMTDRIEMERAAGPHHCRAAERWAGSEGVQP